MRRKCTFICRALMIGCLMSASAQAITIRYVKSNATGLNNGTSWSNAYTNLETALADTALGTLDQIWVAAVSGQAYKPGTSRTGTFSLKSGVEVYGGFIGTETSLGQRDFETNETILSGDIGTTGDPDDNCYHVVTATGVSTSTRLDGFTIKDGRADASNHQVGAGLWIREGTNPLTTSSPMIRNCVFENNVAKRATTTAGAGGGAGPR